MLNQARGVPNGVVRISLGYPGAMGAAGIVGEKFMDCSIRAPLSSPSSFKRVGTGRIWLALLYIVLLAFAGTVAARDDDEPVWDALQQGGFVVLLRHGLTAPGSGDPPGFKLDDCKTQRNLIDEGREQARKLGEAFRAHNIALDRVLSSPWCRCIETARAAFDATPETSIALSNLFGKPENEEKQVADLRRLVSDFRGKGNLVLVSHGSTIVALTGGVTPEPAEMVVVKPEGGGKFSVVGRLIVR